MCLTNDDGSQTNTWYVTIKKEKGTDYVLSWKSKEVNTSKIKPLYTAFLHSINHSGYRIGIKFDKDPLAVDKIIMQQNCKCLHGLWFRCLAKTSY